MKGVQKLLRSKAADDDAISIPPSAMSVLQPGDPDDREPSQGAIDIDRLLALRARLAAALEG